MEVLHVQALWDLSMQSPAVQLQKPETHSSEGAPVKTIPSTVST
jgi:hypothetical protein